eukprot:3932256-Rhodomonas_salina.1
MEVPMVGENAADQVACKEKHWRTVHDDRIQATVLDSRRRDYHHVTEKGLDGHRWNMHVGGIDPEAVVGEARLSGVGRLADVGSLRAAYDARCAGDSQSSQDLGYVPSKVHD